MESDDSSSSSSRVTTPRIRRQIQRSRSFRNLLSDDTSLSNLNISLNPQLSITKSTSQRTYKRNIEPDTDKNDEIETYEAFLKCVLSPLKSQARELETKVNVDSQKVCISPEVESSGFSSGTLTGDESFQMQIIKTLNRIFPGVRNKELIWKRLISIKNFDPSIAVLHKRQLRIGDHEFYSRKNFQSDEQFIKWKAYEMNTSEKLMQIALKERSKHYYYSLEFKINRIIGYLNPISYAIEIGTYKWKSKNSSFSNGVNSFDHSAPKIEEHKEKLDRFPTLKVLIQKGKLIGKEIIGTFSIDLNEVASAYEPKGSWWGVESRNGDKIEISTPDGKISIEYDICLRFQTYPNNIEGTEIDESTLIPHEMIEIFMEKLIYSTDMSSELLSYHEKWLISEFCCLHGVSDQFKHLMILRGLIGRIDLLIPFYHDLNSSLVYIDTMIDDEFPPSTIRERELFNNLLKEVRQRLKSVLINFMYYFPSNEPSNALATLVDILDGIEVRFFKTDSSYLPNQQKQFILSSTKKSYEMMKEDHAEMLEIDDIRDATSFSQFAKVLRESFQVFLCYSMSFHESLDVDTIIVEQLLKLFMKDLQILLEKKDNDPYSVLLLVLELQRFKQTIEEEFEDNLPSVKFPPFKPIIEKYLPSFLKKMGQTLTEWMLNAVSLDSWIPISATEMVSSSIVDFFTSAEKIKSFFVEIAFIDSTSYDHIIKIICNAALGFGNALHRLAVEDIQTKKLISPPERYILKINNLHISKDKLQKLCDSLLTRKSELFPNDNENTLQSKLYVTKTIQDLDDIMDEGISVLVSNILPEVEKTLSKITHEARSVKKDVVDDQSIPTNLKKSTESILSALYTQHFDNIFEISKNTYYNEILMKFLSQLYTGIILKIQSMILKGETLLLKDQKKKQLRPLNHMQILLLKYTLNLLNMYFEGDGEGLSSRIIESTGKAVNGLMAMYILQNTSSLIKTFNALFENPNLSERVGVHITAYYVYLVLRTRSDPEAHSFVKAKKSMVPLIHLKSEFTLLPDEILIESLEVKDSNDILCTLFITNKRMLLDRSLLMTRAGWVEISLNNIMRLTLIKHVSGKGYKIEYYDKGGLFKEKLKRIRLYTTKSGIRRKIFSTMKSVIRASGNTNVDDMSKIDSLGMDYDDFIKSDIDASLETEHSEEGKKDTKPEAIKYYQTLRKQVRKALQDEMKNILQGVAKEEKIVDRFKCKFQGKSGHLYILSFHYFFAPSKDKDPQKIKKSLVHFSSINSINPVGTKILEISFKRDNNIVVDSYSNFLERDEAIECFNISMLNLTSTIKRIEKLKQKEIKEIKKTYMVLKGKFKHEKGTLYLTETQVVWRNSIPDSKLLLWNVKDLIKAKTIIRNFKKGKTIKMKFLYSSSLAPEQPTRVKVSVKSSQDAGEWIRLLTQRKHVLEMQEVSQYQQEKNLK